MEGVFESGVGIMCGILVLTVDCLHLELPFWSDNGIHLVLKVGLRVGQVNLGRNTSYLLCMAVCFSN